MSPPTEIVAGDIGGTNARFALAEIADGQVIKLHDSARFLTRDHASLASSWRAFEAKLGRKLPRAAAIAVACPVTGDILKLTNNPWVIRPATLADELGIDRLTLINDFGAIGHAVPQLTPPHLHHVAGPEHDLPPEGVISVIGPGTGLGAALVLRRAGHTHVIECEGGHADFSALDELEDAMLRILRRRFTRVSVERLVSGPGLRNIYECLGEIEGKPVRLGDDAALWTQAIEGSDTLAAASLGRFCRSLGAFAGDLALSQGANAVVIAGGIVPRLAHLLPHSGFAERFVAKGRFERMMSEIPVKLITHPQPGLLGVAAAFAAAHRNG
ncbi:MAG: glucokinase [Rhodospirillales bacterium 20-64-7]|nr:MAG: glucokinase [Rhodospirillales bacterium 20-64-7]